MIKTCYSQEYYADTPSASMKKLPVIAKIAKEEGLVELIDPGLIPSEILKKLHLPKYVDDFINGIFPLCNSQGWYWSKEIRTGVLAINAGQLLGSAMALEHGVAANIGQGFHHAGYFNGCGYCTFNGLALVAQEMPHLKIGVLDLDEHYGNGTAEFCDRLSNLYNYSIFGSPYGTRIDTDRTKSKSIFNVTYKFDDYILEIKKGLSFLKNNHIDLIIYQAGADTHIDDPIGFTGLTTEQFQIRDDFVFSTIKSYGIPVLFVMAGGYQADIIGKLAPLHVSTFRSAKTIFY
jgi:acetoin utilization deacetylase AcuC-like enzyme